MDFCLGATELRAAYDTLLAAMVVAGILNLNNEPAIISIYGLCISLVSEYKMRVAKISRSN